MYKKMKATHHTKRNKQNCKNSRSASLKIRRERSRYCFGYSVGNYAQIYNQDRENIDSAISTIKALAENEEKSAYVK